ncbi:protein of unknown function [Xenorhabdus poinarii G6]|uniref:Uncharacterized protein n=1 Tax=Xenorhabdus poinarii G6 TaxID=1354304 RepID=A0A068R7F2_9GAMM|nr:protein of unknown function [Xenorhabdus poinarii G6]
MTVRILVSINIVTTITITYLCVAFSYFSIKNKYGYQRKVSNNIDYKNR